MVDRRISNFLTVSFFDNLVKEARDWSQGSSMSRSLIDSVMAFGYQAYLTTIQRLIRLEEKTRAENYVKTALRCYTNVIRSTNTLLKLQVGLMLWPHPQQIAY